MFNNLNKFHTLTIGYLGSYGSFTGEAARFIRKNIFDIVYIDELQYDESNFSLDNIIQRLYTKIRRPRIVAVPCYKELINMVKKGELDYGVVPYQMTRFGELTDITSLLTTNNQNKKENIRICGHISMPLKISLFRKNKAYDAPEINTIISDKYCIKQCEDILERLFKRKNKNFKIIIEDSDASTIAKLMSKDFYSDKTAVLCNKRAGKFFGLNQMIGDMQDELSNHASYVMFSNNEPKEC